MPVADVAGVSPESAETSIRERFAAQAALHPSRQAVRTGSASWTYERLAREARRVSESIHFAAGRGPGRVALLFEQDASMIAAILGTLDAGMTYVPLDPSYPVDRLEYMVQDSATALLLTNDRNVELARSLCGAGGAVINLDALARDPDGSHPFQPVEIPPDTPAYILYTSGSTGRPKGVVQSHRNVLYFMREYARALRIGPDDRLSLLASYSFDAAVMDIFGALLNGATLCLWNVKTQGVAGMADWLTREGITIFHAVPAVFRAFCSSLGERQAFANVRRVVLGGEEALRGDVDAYLRHFPAPCVLVNGLGPTESTLALQYFVDHSTDLHGASVPVGYPVAGTEIVLLDEHGLPAPAETSGEIGIRSAHLALGYWGRPELTDAAFLPDPEGGDRRIYRTGDLGCLLPSGAMQFLGRKGSLVKIRGHRIELGEIESVLGSHPDVSGIVVTASDDSRGEKRLIAHVVPAAPSPAGSPERADAERDLFRQLRALARNRLPDYMHPAAFVALDALPLLPNGKVDRRALPPPAEPAPDSAYVAPRDAAESVLAAIWGPLLGLDRIGRNDDFFALGGHSLLATQVISRVRDVFKVELPLAAVFESPTIAGLAARISSAVGSHAAPPEAPIAPIERSGGLELSFAQQRLWFLDQLEPGNASYVSSRVVELTGSLDAGALERAFDSLIQRHESLRTHFELVEGAPFQVVDGKSDFHLALEDLRAIPEESRLETANRRAAELAGRSFDLSASPMIRGTLLRLTEDRHFLVVVIHHVASDDWSMAILVKEVSILYREAQRGEASSLTPLPLQYADFARWQRARLGGDLLERNLSYWKDHLANLVTLDLPADRPRPPSQSFRGAMLSMTLGRDLSDTVRSLARREGATLYMVLLAAFHVLLSRYTGQDDFAIASPIAGRNRAELEGLIGIFVNTLVMRVNSSGNPSFRELLRRTRSVCHDAYSHQDLPFERIVEELRPERSLDRNPLVSVLFGVETAPSASFDLPGLSAAPRIVANGATRFDLEIGIGEDRDGLVCKVTYATDLYEEATIARMLGHFQTLLECAGRAPDRPIRDLTMLTEPERTEILDVWNRTKEDRPGAGTPVHRLFEEQAEKRPHATAVLSGTTRTTYRRLNQRANRLARFLARRGVGPTSLVGLCVDRSADMLVGLLGILKAGAAYLPLDPAYPRARLDLMLRDAGVSVVVTQSAFRALFPEDSASLVLLDRDGDQIQREGGENPPNPASPRGLAYVIYTSGSTGVPKGVAIEHHSVANLLLSLKSRLGIRPDDVWMAITTLSFDIAALEMFLPLLTGAAVAIVSREVASDGHALRAELTQRGATVMQATPVTWRLLLSSGWEGRGLRMALCGGEAFPDALAEQLLDRVPSVWNLYGPTETTIWSTAWRVERGVHPIPIGRPLDNTQLFILDPHGHPVPVHVSGELYIGGSGVARGYLNRPDLTEERFVANPFTSTGARMYRTGDRAKFLPSGDVQYLGRLDRQVKVRGHRIEIGEIEAALAQFREIRECAVDAGSDESGGHRLIAYVVPRRGRKPTNAQFRRFLKSTLPDFMIPSAFVFVEEFPLTPNGKVDRAALAGMGLERLGPTDAYTAPRNRMEERLAEICGRLLQLRAVGVHDNFFDLGGHSLLAVQLAAEIERLAGRRLPLASIFRAPTVAGLAAILQGDVRPKGGSPSIVEIQGTGTRPPFFCVHAVSGIPFYRDLALLLGPDQPFYGLQSQGLDGSCRPVETVEAMAALYVREIRGVQPQGPYYLGGYSFGGKIAFEMARQLRAQGQTTALLAFLDASSLPTGSGPAGVAAQPSRSQMIRARARIHIAAIQEIGARDKAAYVIARARTVFDVFRRVAARAHETLFRREQRARRRVLEANHRAADLYVPGAYEGRATILRARDRWKDFPAEAARADSSLGWESLCGGGVEIFEIPGGHFSLLEEEQSLRALAEILAEQLLEAQSASPGTLLLASSR